MTVCKEDLLDLAQSLLAGQTEPHLRSAVSRAYYAAYHGCKDWHSALPMPGSNTGPGGGNHQQLINQLCNPDASVVGADKMKSKVLSVKLGVLRKTRHEADYELLQTIDGAQAAKAYALAAEILGKL